MHCINIIIVSRKELRSNTIDSILDDKKMDLQYVELPQGMIAFPELYNKSVYRKLGEGIKFVNLSTDYFGGSGEQSAELNISTSDKEGYKTISESYDYDAINKILKEYGVIREDGSDEFDTINLGKYRKNEDFLI